MNFADKTSLVSVEQVLLGNLKYKKYFAYPYVRLNPLRIARESKLNFFNDLRHIDVNIELGFSASNLISNLNVSTNYNDEEISLPIYSYFYASKQINIKKVKKNFRFDD